MTEGRLGEVPCSNELPNGLLDRSRFEWLLQEKSL